MPFKINISEKSGKTFHLNLENAEGIMRKKLHEKVKGNEFSPDLNGYEFEITGASDKAGFTAMEDIEGVGLKRVLLNYGKGMKSRPKKEGKKKRSKLRPKGLRMRKTVRGNTISEDTSQINLKILNEGSKKLGEIFPEQNQKKEKATKEAKPAEEKPAEKKKG